MTSSNVIPLAPTAPAEQELTDAHMSTYLATQFGDRFVWVRGLGGWLEFDGKRWTESTEEELVAAVHSALIDFRTTESAAGVDSDRMRSIQRLLSASRMLGLARLLRGQLSAKAEVFDAHPDLLNCANGVVDLRTAEVKPHDPRLYLTKISPVKYRPDAHHADWETALQALPADVGAWLQIRMGQAATGHATSDDVMPILKGGGENGKSTLLAPIMRALGDYAVPVSDRVLLANPGDHPVELMTLRGARLAVAEELPEGRHLNTKRIKDMLGTDPMSSRYMHGNPIQWAPTHSLFVSSNFTPTVSETDHGSWRRLALVRFPYTYRAQSGTESDTDKPIDRTLRDRLKGGTDGRLEAVLAWLVDGALGWYAEGKAFPPAPDTVTSDTREWRSNSDMIIRFFDEELIPSPAHHVSAKEMHDVFSTWLSGQGKPQWSAQTFTERFESHDQVTGAGITKSRTYNTTPGHSIRNFSDTVPGRFRAWMGVRFRLPSDTE